VQIVAVDAAREVDDVTELVSWVWWGAEREESAVESDVDYIL
jgi:hypothetical protein